MRLNAAVETEEADLLQAVPMKGEFGIEESRLVVPGDPYRSVLYYRIATSGAGHMPMLGSRTVDPAGVRVVHDWIRSLDPGKVVAEARHPPRSVAEALAVYHRVTGLESRSPERRVLIESCLASEVPYVRNLFDTYRDDPAGASE